jgi:hypothetical protein
MIRSKEYIKSKFETGDIPTQDDYSDFIDSCYNEGGISGVTFDIPEVNLYTKEYISGSKPRRSERLIAYWTQADKRFLQYDPKLWLYRYKNNKKKLESSDIIKHKKEVHTPHLNGVNYPSSKYYSGSFFSVVSDISSTGVHTEFDISIVENSGFTVDIDPYDWFYMIGASPYKLNDALPLTNPGYYLKVMGRPKNNLSFLFRLAITIEDPYGGEQRIVGPMSDVIALRLEQEHFVYRRRLSSLSNKRFVM